MTTNDAQNEQIGYGKPPKAGQFKKGKSGNRRGRPKGSKNFSTVVESTLNQPVEVNENGRRKTITKEQAMMTQLINKAAAGDARATQQVIAIRKMMGETDQIQVATAVTDELDRQVMQHIIARVRATVPTSGGQEPKVTEAAESPQNRVDARQCATVADESAPIIQVVTPLFPERVQDPGTAVSTANQEAPVHE